MTEVENKQTHMELVQGVIDNFPADAQNRFCMKHNVVVHISQLKSKEFSCWKCAYHVSWGTDIYAVCDPI